MKRLYSILLATVISFVLSPSLFAQRPAGSPVIFSDSSATFSSPLRAIRGEVTLTHTGSTTASGSVVGVRGAVTVSSATSMGSGSYLYGTQGKVITNAGTLDLGAGYAFGSFGQLDVSGGTITSGHVAAVGGNIYGYNSGTSTVLTTLYLEAAGGGVINSQINTYGKATYWANIQTNSHTPEANTTCTPSAVTGATGGIQVIVDGVARWIPLAATCP